MQSTQDLKRRMKSVHNIGQITKAMELVAATKMRKAQELALDSRPYSYAALELLGVLSELKDVPRPPLLEKRPVARTAFLIVTSDKGLAGAFNSAVIRKFEQYARAEKIDVADPGQSFIAVGQKARAYLARQKANIAASFTRAGDYTRMEEVRPMADALIEGYLRGDFDRVIAFYTTFVTALRQDAVMREFLPIDLEAIKQSIEETIPRAGRYSEYARSESFLKDDGRADYIIEPTPSEVLAELAPRLLTVRIYNAILEANASEHSARRMAMRNASDNAAELSQNLNIEYNKSRQAAITNQIIEVTSGAQSLSS